MYTTGEPSAHVHSAVSAQVDVPAHVGPWKPMYVPFAPMPEPMAAFAAAFSSALWMVARSPPRAWQSARAVLQGR